MIDGFLKRFSEARTARGITTAAGCYQMGGAPGVPRHEYMSADWIVKVEVYASYPRVI